jgi:hypothetical protein
LQLDKDQTGNKDMKTNNTHPKWWQVYLTFPLLIALFMLDHSFKLSERGHVVAQIGILVFVYWLIRLWLKANAAALLEMDQKQYRNTFTVIRIPPRQLPNSNGSKRPMFQLSNSEIKGTLSSTFEMDYIDAEFSSMDEINKE